MKRNKAQQINLEYPLSPKSVTAEHLQSFGEAFYNNLKSSSKRCFITAGIAAIVCIFIGSLICTVTLIGIMWFVIGFMLVMITAVSGLRDKKHYTENTIEQLGQEKLNKYFEQQKSSFNRAIDVPYYSECDELNSINFTPTVYARGGTFVAIEAADALIDEANGKFAVCTTYGDITLFPANVFEMSKVLVVSLVNNGETIYETQNQDGLGRAALGYVVAGGLGAMVGASTASTKTVAKKLDDLSVVITYNDLGRAYLTFKFGKDKIGAEQLYQIFTVVSKRNEAKM